MTQKLGLKEKIELVKKEMFKKFPACAHTVKILLWDDNTDLVECCHGDGEKIYKYAYYNDELIYDESIMLTNRMRADETGEEFYVMTPNEYSDYLEKIQFKQ